MSNWECLVDAEWIPPKQGHIDHCGYSDAVPEQIGAKIEHSALVANHQANDRLLLGAT